jgi:hypothetical protein
LKTTGLLAAFAVLTVAGSGSAQLAQTNTDTPAKTTPVTNGRICRTEDMTGSHFTQKVCRTRSEWMQIDAGNEADTDKVFRMRRGAGGKLGVAE